MKKGRTDEYERYNFQGILMQQLAERVEELGELMARAQENKASAYRRAYSKINVLKNLIESWFKKHSKIQIEKVRLNLALAKKFYEYNEFEQGYMHLETAFVHCLEILKQNEVVFGKGRTSYSWGDFVESHTK